MNSVESTESVELEKYFSKKYVFNVTGPSGALLFDRDQRLH